VVVGSSTKVGIVAGITVGIVPAVVGILATVEVVGIVTASAFDGSVGAADVEPGIVVAVVVAGTLGIAAVGGASAAVGIVQR
jgi:hypothetical protein